MQCLTKDKEPGIWFGVAYAVCILLCMKTAVNYLSVNEVNGLKSMDYVQIEANQAMLGNVTMYYPVAGDQIGYYKFPSTPYTARLELIEIREDDLDKGFRMKEEYRDAYVTTYGQLHEESMFE